MKLSTVMEAMGDAHQTRCVRTLVWGVVLTIFLIWPASLFADGSSESDRQIWKVGGRRWTVQEEKKYAKWVEANITEDFFIRNRIPVDCADVVYAARWIYARISHLPAAATTVDKRLTGHWSTDWGHLRTNEPWNRDRRFRAALLFMLAKTWTRTLPADVYPVKVDADAVQAGTAFYTTESHSGIVRSIVLDGSAAHPIQTAEATLPCRVQKLRFKDFNSPDPEPQSYSGLVQFRWPTERNGRWEYLPVREHPYYSEEQYFPAFHEGYADYIDAVAGRIDPKIYDPRERVHRILEVLSRRLKERIPIVLDGQSKCPRGHCPEGSVLWEIYSTPGRDESLIVAISHLEDILKQSRIDRESVLEEADRIPLQISPDRRITVKHSLENARWFSSDPEASVAARWGLDKCDAIAMHIRSAEDAIQFIIETYGHKDPEFAERSLWVRRHDLDELVEQRRKSHCELSPVHY
ncbi:MAG: hypothetical protein LLG97_08615 [Deltaproteobacteria bacterium]|nr:hypothetical protein [Deltaproteobacteria bacterium]